MFSEIAEKDIEELNQRLHDRTQAFLANEVKLLNKIRELEEKNSLLQSIIDPREKKEKTILQHRFYDSYAHELSNWEDLSPATVRMYYGNDPAKWPEICEEKMKRDTNEEYRIVVESKAIIWPPHHGILS